MRCKAALAALFLGAVAWPVSSGAQVFEVIHPDVVQGQMAVEVLNGLVLDDIDDGDERSVHEFAFAYSPTSWWKSTVAFEVANPEKEDTEFEAVELENVFLLPFGEAYGQGHSHDHGSHGTVALELFGIFLGAELPTEGRGGWESGAVSFGPVVEVAIGPVLTIANFSLEVPFEEGGTGIGYGLQAVYPVSKNFGIGFEAHGEVENAFRSGESEEKHYVGPAIYMNFDIGIGQTLEPRLAILFGLGRPAPDATASLNFELKF